MIIDREGKSRVPSYISEPHIVEGIQHGSWHVSGLCVHSMFHDVTIGNTI